MSTPKVCVQAVKIEVFEAIERLLANPGRATVSKALLT